MLAQLDEAKEAEPKELELAFSKEPILGWRAWKVLPYERRGKMTEHRLNALGVTWAWEPRTEQKALCTERGSHEAPWPDCKCGFWAFQERRQVEEALPGYDRGSIMVIGQVYLGGRVLECKNGWRGEIAYPKNLIFFSTEEALPKEVADLYGVPYTREERVKHTCEGVLWQWDYESSHYVHNTTATYRYTCGAMLQMVGQTPEDPRTWPIPPCPNCQA